ncbi:hypothetical protein RsS62_20290 [Rhizobium dioscoreae]|uniref:Uncharacterized protein n=1 Tax=Rhizobium dioscoreae TaxID=2653122 RepID=A0ABQ0Z5G8_9HYPH|nr:hypothetical protein RsS62_20290 [Rhizobium dioscoreae]GES50586.1 hypothetical protein RsS93_32000 [Rhizobium dioscoreae]GLU81653.1 hypothetical protein Rhsp01_28290 [Rhizobium sp. NBRC 114257]
MDEDLPPDSAAALTRPSTKAEAPKTDKQSSSSDTLIPIPRRTPGQRKAAPVPDPSAVT